MHAAASLYACFNSLSSGGRAIHLDGVLAFDPADEFVELDGLLGGGKGVAGRKSVLAGGFSSSAGGRGYAGHWRLSATAGIGWGLSIVGLQALSAKVSGSQACFEVMGRPFVDRDLRRANLLAGGVIGGASGVGRGAVVSDGSCACRLFVAVQLFKLPALLAPVTSLELLDDQRGEEG